MPSLPQPPLILVLEDVDETRYGIERLLTDSGYRVTTARNEAEAAFSATLQHPDLILVSLGLSAAHVLPLAHRIRHSAGLGENVPIVAFSISTLHEGDEVSIGHNVHLARPDNFNQLRSSLARLLQMKA